MTDLEKKAVADLKNLIKRIEDGEYNITYAGLVNHIEQTNIYTDADAELGPIEQWETRYTIMHYRRP